MPAPAQPSLVSRRARSRPSHVFGALVVCAGLFASCGLGACKIIKSEPEPRLPPRLVVLVVVDQLRGDELDRHRVLLRDGLDRMIRQGRWYTHAMHGHARTETAAGHATIATGLYPRLHGVVDKRLYDDERRKVMRVCSFGSGPCDPDVLLEKTLGDRLKAHDPKSKVVAVAQKPRSSVLLGGTSADLVVWLGPWEADGSGGIDGRHQGVAGLPGWLTRFHSQIASPDRIARIWELPRLPPEYATLRDDVSCEIDCGHGTTFPHHLPTGVGGDKLYWGWLATPDSDRAIAEIALQAVLREGLGTDDSPDLLAVSLGGFDAIGHNFGPDSLERAAAFIELDRQLGDLLDRLTEHVGPRVLVGLTSDHGIAPAVEMALARGQRSGRVKEQALRGAVEGALGARFGPGTYVEAMPFPFLKLIDMPPQQRTEAARVAAAALTAMPEVHRAFVNSDLPSQVRGGDELTRLVWENVHPGRSGDVTIMLEPFHAAWMKYRGDHGSEHGSPWKYDRHVPVMLWGDGVTAGKVTDDVAVIDLIRTLGDRLGVPVDARGGVPLK